MTGSLGRALSVAVRAVALGATHNRETMAANTQDPSFRNFPPEYRWSHRLLGALNSAPCLCNIDQRSETSAFGWLRP